MSYQLYPSDLTDREWDLIKPLIPPAKPGGRPRKLDMRLVLNAMFSGVRGGIAWALLPREYPNRKSVYPYLRLWRLEGTWQRIHDRLRGDCREAVGAIDNRRRPSSTRRASRRRRWEGRSEVTMPARRWQAANATSWWTAWGSSW